MRFLVDHWGMPLEENKYETLFSSEDFVHDLGSWVENNSQDGLNDYYAQNPKPINRSPNKPLYKGLLLSKKLWERLQKEKELPPRGLIESWSYSERTAISLTSMYLQEGEAHVLQVRRIPASDRWLYLDDEFMSYAEPYGIEHYGEEEVICKSQPLLLSECKILRQM